MNRREFLRQTSAAATYTAAGLLARKTAAATLSSSPTKSVSIVSDPADPVANTKPAQWALERLEEALVARNYTVTRHTRIAELRDDSRILVASGPATNFARGANPLLPDSPESLVIACGEFAGRDALLAAGKDVRGLVYALTELADAITLGDPTSALYPDQPVIRRPLNRVRSVIRLFSSDVEDKGWFNDRTFWRRYFAMLVSHRFNRVNLSLGLGYDQPTGLRDTYFYFAYPFLVSVPGYSVRATHLSDAERDANLAMLRWISDEAAAHALDFQLGLWTHAYQWTNSPDANHVIEGLTADTHAPYCRDALAMILKECPAITGVTLRIHGESGVPEGNPDFWRTVFEGCVRSGRRVELDLHAKGMDQPIIDAALSTGLPLTISPKFWAEHLGLPYHQAAIRPTELPSGKSGRGPFTLSEGSRSFLRYGYGDLLREDRKYSIVHRIWPGTQRILLWADPVFAAAYAGAFTFCGSAGAEFFDPLSFKGRKGSGLGGGRDGYVDATLRPPGGDFEKHQLTYRLWGRSLYDPQTPPVVWERKLRADYGFASTAAAATALGHASRILPLFTTAHCPSAANNHFWPEMYVNMAIADDAAPIVPYTDTLDPKRFCSVSPLDPQLFSRIQDFADELIAGRVSPKYSPIEVAQWMEDLASEARSALAEAEAKALDPHAPPFRRFAIDTTLLAGLGRFFARKLRAAVLYSIYVGTKDTGVIAAAVKTYVAARDEWAKLGQVATGVYVPDVTYGDAWYQRGHWADRLPAIDADIAAMTRIADAPRAIDANVNQPPPDFSAVISKVLGRPMRSRVTATHVADTAFAPGKPCEITVTVAEPIRTIAVSLHYRHTHQAETWRTVEMSVTGESHHATIPSDYTDTVYPLQYYFEGRGASGEAWLFPGLGESLTQQPYFVRRPTTRTVVSSG